MKYIYDTATIRSCESYTINEVGIPAAVLMERAAFFVAEKAIEMLAGIKEPRILVICGSGNNGGDGLAAARILAEYGFGSHIYAVKGKESPQYQEQFSMIRKLVSEKEYKIKFTDEIQDSYDLVIDAVFGIGLNRDLSPEIKTIIHKINALKAIKLSVDIPSGLFTDSGKAEPSVKADTTVTFGGLKKGFYLREGPNVTGDIRAVSIGIPMDESKASFSALEMEDLRVSRYFKSATAHKGLYGRTLVIAGSKDIYGAAYLCTKAAFSSGAGLVKVLTHDNNRYSFEHDLPEAMYSFYSDGQAANPIEGLGSFDTVVIGPGLSVSDTGKQLVRSLINGMTGDTIYVFDADAINVLAGDKDLFEQLVHNVGSMKCKVVFTPHKGELNRLKQALDPNTENGFADSFYNRYGIVLVEKDARTRIYGTGRYINIFGNEGMATAGSGDVLAGILGGALNRFKLGGEDDLAKCAAFCVMIHSLAGDMACNEKGPVAMTAGDILNKVGEVLRF